mgnify:CR=1 FL=1
MTESNDDLVAKIDEALARLAGYREQQLFQADSISLQLGFV